MHVCRLLDKECVELVHMFVIFVCLFNQDADKALQKKPVEKNLPEKILTPTQFLWEELRTQNSLFRPVQPGDSTLRLIGVAIMRVTYSPMPLLLCTV